MKKFFALKVYAQQRGTRMGNARNQGFELDDGGVGGIQPTTRAGARGLSRATGNAAGGTRTGRR